MDPFTKESPKDVTPAGHKEHFHIGSLQNLIDVGPLKPIDPPGNKIATTNFGQFIFVTSFPDNSRPLLI
jgi:hypothetical protein